MTDQLDPATLLHERYTDARAGSATRRLYYPLKPLLPRAAQLYLRRAYAHVQRRRRFPAWPIEPILVRHQEQQFRERMSESPDGSVPFVNFWPARSRFCFVLTHDVEGPAGIRNIEPVRALERDRGFVSSWNFVAEDYPIPDGLFAELRADGCEVGLHGIRHDDKMFRDRRGFEADLPKVERYLEDWGAVGFRSPATNRNAAWMHELPCLYDSSFPDTDPFEPTPGGCCSIFPFFFGGVVELPITLVQDHTLFEILGAPSIARWLQKSEWIVQHHGLINLIVHPDYAMDASRLAHYREFLDFLAEQPDGWHDLPQNVALWWRQREQLSCDAGANGAQRVIGETDFSPTVAYARERAGEIVFDA